MNKKKVCKHTGVRCLYCALLKSKWSVKQNISFAYTNIV